MQSTITVDIGTTSVKLCLFDAESSVLNSHRLPTPTVADAWGEVYDVDALLAGIGDFVSGLDGSARAAVRRIAITGVGESGGLVRGDASLASPIILWHDQRGLAYLNRLTPEERSRIYRITGLPVNGNYGLSKTAWALDHAEPNSADAQWLNIAEYLAAVMSGERWSEPSLASRTMALDLTTQTFSEEICSLFGVDVRVFPPLRPASAGKPVTEAFAQATGLDPKVHVHVAGHDHMVGGAGAGQEAGELLNSTGTTEGLLFLSESPRLDRRFEQAKLANGLDPSGSGYTLFASIPTGGSAFATLMSMLDTNAEALNVCLSGLHSRYLAGEIDLSAVPIVLPQFRGSPPPAKRPSARGLIAGIGNSTTMEEIVFGTFLGMVLQFRDVLELFDVETRRIKVIGPASSNPLWLQLKADLLGTPLTASRFPEVVSRGAQVLASAETGSRPETQPFDVEPNTTRQQHLNEWCANVQAQWDHLKGMPS